ncbi:hypothetical protein N0V90_011706 [Kalmusia sp. IMI 367209]|nr:hypothetical protein N0V90_011706 [Kalmusia sp. IMI 367209]
MHCFDALRQYVMCNIDDTLMWTNGHREAGVGQEKKCGDWDALREWAEERSADYFDFERVAGKDQGDRWLPRSERVLLSTSKCRQDKPYTLQRLDEMGPTKDVAWWTNRIDHKITAKRDKAWAIKGYPCTGLGGFLMPSISRLPNYGDIISRIKHGGSFLDMGCYMGTDLRQLSMDGCPQDRLYGMDIVNHWDLGFELFRDKGRFDAKIIQADIFQPNQELLELKGSVDIISATHFFHNWTWREQFDASCTVAALVKPGGKVVGFQVGNFNEGRRGDIHPKLMLHDVNTFAALWNEVGKTTGTRWQTDAVMRSWESMGYWKDEVAYIGADAGILQFVVSRIS